ncbi:MAG: isoleucine--tRNA ligase, partial [Pseudomonadales bacterium]|nr:isoleucine--tRNA ligase [Pseudomonadales bacterium]
AVSLHPELDYVALACTPAGIGEPMRLVVAEALVEQVVQRYSLAQHEVVGRFRGADVELQLLQHPFYAKQVPIILGEHVTTEAGTGCVHTAPDHGADDFAVAQRYDIETLNLVGGNGVYSDSTELFAGEHVYKVDQRIVELLRERGRLSADETISHSFPHCWRTKTPLIFRATPQWFIGMQQKNLLDEVKRACDDVQWVPDWGRARIDSMLASSPDWCISRQRTWGVPITLFIHNESQQLHPRTVELIEQVAQRIEQKGIEAWFAMPAEELLGDDAEHYSKVTDTLDVWFDSGVTHYSVLRQTDGLRFPADLYLEGSDQHRGWFQSSLKTAMAMDGVPPYKTVLTHGFTVDAEGKKMSKSMGNIVAPQAVMKELGADVLRLWVAATDFSSEMSVSDEILKRVADSYRRIRNTARFLLSNLQGFDPATDLVSNDKLLLLDRWAITRAAQLQAEIVAAYNSFQLHLIYQKLHNFCVVDLGSIYLDIIKDRQYTTQADSLPRRSAQTALYHIIQAFTRWLAPILSFTADELYEFIPGPHRDSVLLEELYEGVGSLLKPGDASGRGDEAAMMQSLCSVKEAINKALESKRSAGELGGSLEAEVTLYANAELAGHLQGLGDELRFALITSAASVASIDAAPANALQTELEGLRLTVQRSAHSKCVRCWHHRPEVGADTKHPALCARCIDNVDGAGESRAFV